MGIRVGGPLPSRLGSSTHGTPVITTPLGDGIYDCLPFTDEETEASGLRSWCPGAWSGC